MRDKSSIKEKFGDFICDIFEKISLVIGYILKKTVYREDESQYEWQYWSNEEVKDFERRRKEARKVRSRLIKNGIEPYEAEVDAMKKFDLENEIMSRDDFLYVAKHHAYRLDKKMKDANKIRSYTIVTALIIAIGIVVYAGISRVSNGNLLVISSVSCATIITLIALMFSYPYKRRRDEMLSLLPQDNSNAAR